MIALDPADAAAFRDVVARLPAAEQARVAALADGAATAAAQAASHWRFEQPADAADALLAGDDTHRRALVAHWALQLPERYAPLNLPASVLAELPGAVTRLARFLIEAIGSYDPDYWAKDVRFVLGLTVPCGAQAVDLSARIGPGEVLRHVRAGRGTGATRAYLAARGWGCWLQIHTESRHLIDFNEAGFDACYRRIADLLESRPAMRGMMGASWFYDPPLREISPRLAYLQERPLAAGAFLIHQGTADLYTERATATSPTRKALVEAGQYTPRSWILAWPRAALIRWARSG